LRGFLREVLTRSSTFDYYPGLDPWGDAVEPWGSLGDLIYDEEPELEQGDTGPDNGVYFALTRLVCLQTLSYQSSVVNADKHSY
jgi:hypothetical protein